MRSKINHLFAGIMRLKNFFRGMGTVLEIMPLRVPKLKQRRFATDTDALKSDWEKIGSDFRKAIEQTKQTTTK